MRIVETYITADGRVTQDPAEAVRLDRDVYDDAGQLVRRETWNALAIDEAHALGEL